MSPARRRADSADLAVLTDRARAGDHRAVARLISLVEDAAGSLPDLAAALVPFAGDAHVTGLTGAPGVGKSTCTAQLVALLRKRTERVGVLAVDPSSPFSGGALLGDRVRMQEHATDAGVYIRSMASRGHLGGLSWSTPQAVRVLDAAGCAEILVETVGVGQAEVDIAATADTTVVLLAPGMGDGIQAAKAGIVEIADIFAVNKADREGADTVVKDLRSMLSLGGRHSEAGAWRPPVVKLTAAKGEGVEKLLQEIDRHREWLRAGGELHRRRVTRAEQEIEAIAVTTLRSQLADLHGGTALSALAADVVNGRTDPYAAAAALLAAAES